MAQCGCDYCAYPLEVGMPTEDGYDRFLCLLERDRRPEPRFRFPRAALKIPNNAPVRSGWVNPSGGYVAWPSSNRDFERFCARYGLGVAYSTGGMQLVLREIGLTRMQTDAFMLVEGMGLTQARTAAVFGITQGAVSLRLAGARVRLRAWRKQNLITIHLLPPIGEGPKHSNLNSDEEAPSFVLSESRNEISRRSA